MGTDANEPTLGTPHQRRARWRVRDAGALKIGMVAGIIFVIAVTGLQSLHLLRQDPDLAADRIVPYLLGVVQHPERVRPFVFLDIDDATYQHWQQPLFTPRDRLADLIEIAAAGSPALIFVDIDLSRTSASPLIGPPAAQADSCERLDAGDQRLCTAIINATRRSPVVLARAFGIGAHQPDSRGALEPLPSFLDPVFGTGPGGEDAAEDSLWASAKTPNLYWASPLYDRDAELRVRHWRLWEPACAAGRLRPMPSVPLVVAALVQPSPPRGEIGVLTEALRLQDRPCTDEKPALGHPKVAFSSGKLDLADQHFGQRVVYTLDAHSGLLATVPVSTPGRREEVPVLRVISAKDVAGSDARQRIDTGIFRQRIVVIGASHQHSGDIHRTPLGMMPGALVNINAIHSLLDYGQLKPPELWLRFVVSAVTICMIVYMFHIFYYSIATILSGIFILTLFVTVNYFTLPTSVLYDLSLAGILFVLYKWFVIGFFNVFQKGWQFKICGWRFWTWIRKKDGVGWRALLAARYHH